MYILLSELQSLRRTDRTIVFYQHHTMRKGGHDAETLRLMERLNAGFSTVDAPGRVRPCRACFLYLMRHPRLGHALKASRSAGAAASP
jgi:hypothetical protein